LEALQESVHPDYDDEPLPVSSPVPETTTFEQASAPRVRQHDGEELRYALTVWEMPGHDVVVRAGQAYSDLAELVDSYAK
jgi:hypothetical protein